MINEASNKIKNIVYFLIFSILLFAFSFLNACNSKTNEEKKAIVNQNLITAQEQIGLSQLLNISGYHLTNNGMYVNRFEDKVYSFIYDNRVEKPANPRYFFCDVKEFTKISDLFKNNINNNPTIEEIGLKIIERNRKKCFENKK
jgi:hypothetical protein